MDSELKSAVPFIEDRLYYVALRHTPRQSSRNHFFSTDNTLIYWNFFLDFGPLNLGQTFKFCQALLHKLEDPALANKRIYYYSSTHSHKRANSAFMMGVFAMLYLGRTPEEAIRPFRNVYPPFPPFHDASPCVCTYNLTVLDCLKGAHRALRCGFFNFDTFDIKEYDYFEKVENGDLNWLVEGKFLAFAGPHDTKTSIDGYQTLTPEDYVPYYKKKNVGLVVRLNKKYYDERKFTRHGIRHVDMYYLDGSVPPEPILQKFLKVCEETDRRGQAIAVHCKAGLGRTGTCIGCYIMKHYGFTAAEIIGWLRVCRPGSVIGPQQHYLRDSQSRMWKAGEAYRQQLAMNAEYSGGSHRAAGVGDSTVELSSDFDNMSFDGAEGEGRSQGDGLRSRKSPKAHQHSTAGRSQYK